MTLIKDISVYNSLSDAEKTVIDFLDSNEEKIQNLSITMIANRTYTSIATVSRAIRKMGYSGGITELRYTSQKINSATNGAEGNQLTNINEILAKSYRECDITLDNIIISDILKIVTEIRKAERVWIFALGSSAKIASEFRDQLLYLGIYSILIEDEVVMDRAHFQTSAKDVAFFISALNTSPKLYKTARRIKNSHIKIYTCICKENTNLERISDITILGHTEAMPNSKILFTTSRIPLMIMTRTIIEYLAIDS